MSKRCCLACSIAAAPSAASSEFEPESARLQHLADDRAHGGRIVDDQNLVRQARADAVVDQMRSAPASSIGLASTPSTARPSVSTSRVFNSAAPTRIASGRSMAARMPPSNCSSFAFGIRESTKTTSKCVPRQRRAGRRCIARRVDLDDLDRDRGLRAARRISSRSAAASETISILSETSSSLIHPPCHAQRHARGQLAAHATDRHSSALRTQKLSIPPDRAARICSYARPNSNRWLGKSRSHCEWQRLQRTAPPRLATRLSSSPCHITLRPRTKVPTGQPVTRMPS